MTGFGEARLQRDGLAVAVELRSINSRYLKISVRCGEGFGALEPQVETRLREKFHRGTIQVNVRIDRAHAADDYQVDIDVLDAYRQALSGWCRKAGVEEEVLLSGLLALPGVIREGGGSTQAAGEAWPVLEEALDEAVEKLTQMRAEEGAAMETDLRANCQAARECVDRIETRAPQVVDDYRARLKERLGRVLAEYEVSLEPADLIKEVGLFAERSDISEEIVRLRSHFDQFESICSLTESNGRKLEFLTQEMFRETNTIGSKANDVEIAREVIEIKAAVERMREMIQNVE
ncbi:MAG: YicC family protein [Pirellulales bacterium]|nr:YicC family protein [Pirellulales bacterium]